MRARRIRTHTVGLERMDQVVEPVTADVIDDVRAAAAGKLKAIKRELERTAPRASGRFAASFVPYVSVPPSHAPAPGDSSPMTDAQVDQVVSTWQPGHAMGLVSNLGYSRRLAFHNWSRKAANGWFKLAIDRGLAVEVA